LRESPSNKCLREVFLLKRNKPDMGLCLDARLKSWENPFIRFANPIKGQGIAANRKSMFKQSIKTCEYVSLGKKGGSSQKGRKGSGFLVRAIQAGNSQRRVSMQRNRNVQLLNEKGERM